MSDVIKVLQELLGKYDHELQPLAEYEISEAIRSLRDPKDVSEPPMQWIAEVMAFAFCEDYQDKSGGWGTYFGPMMVMPGKGGTVIEYPSIKMITRAIIQYWCERAAAAQHPVLRVRYADVVWDFSVVATETRPHYSMAHIVIDSTIEIAQKNCHKHETTVIKRLERALSLAIMLNDAIRVEKVRDIIIGYEDSVTQDSRLGLWGFSYDLLCDNDKVELTIAQEQKLIGDLEGHLLRASQPAKLGEIDPWAAEAAALRLAKHYRRVGRIVDVERVLNVLGDSFIQASSSTSALQASALLQRVHAIFTEFGLTEEAKRISAALRELGPKVASELKPISVNIEIPEEKIEKYVAAVTQGDAENVLARIAALYIPRRAEIEKQLQELASKAPIQFLVKTELLDDQGRPVAKVGSLEEDLTGHAVKQMSQNMAIESMFLRRVLERMATNPAFETSFVDYLFRSPVFEKDRKSVIESAIREYLRGNHLSAVHLLIPQIENAFRVLLEKAGGSVLKPPRGGGFNLRILDDILRDPLMLQIVGEDAIIYFRVLLVDPRGWNLRNRVCHGLLTANEFEPLMSDRLIHVLLCLAQVREQEPEGK